MNYYNEFDPSAAQWLRNLITLGLIPPGDVDTRSIVDVQPADLAGYSQVHLFAGIGGWSRALELAGWPTDRPIWTGSCPCQPFSVAGRRGGTDDVRHLWPDMFRFVRAARPAVVVGEQVAGAAGYGWFDGVSADLEREGYACRAVDIPACAVNAPHIRQRLYWCAVADAERAERWQDADQGGSADLPKANGRVKVPSAVAFGDGSVADAAGPRRDAAAHAGVRCEAQGERPRNVEPERLSGAHSSMADADRSGRAGRADDPQRHAERRASAERVDDVEHAPSLGWRKRRPEPVIWGGRDAATGADVCVEHAHDERRKKQRGTEPVRAEQRSVERADGGFWDDHIVISCHDGKARRAQPRISMLVDGVPGRVAAWRGLGNAISPPLAAEVIKALMETLP
jgi:DNA (cytosine-5)-methyltransferase 1